MPGFLECLPNASHIKPCLGIARATGRIQQKSKGIADVERLQMWILQKTSRPNG
jgi:hypothetical protein